MAKEIKKKTPARAAKATAAKKPVAKVKAAAARKPAAKVKAAAARKPAAKARAAAARKPAAKIAAKPVAKREMNDYSGPWNPDLVFDDFSKEFILKLMQVWQYAWLHMTEAWYDAVKERVDKETADVCETAAWCRIGERVNPRFAKVANNEMKTVVDCLKNLQLPLDNTTGGLFPAQAEIINPNHVIWTIPRCRSLEFFEAKAPERIKYVCYENERRVIERYLVNRKIRVTPLKLPPRKGPEEIACKWEFKMMDTDQWSEFKMPPKK
jgi:hypothetical protein